jgi:hypothetical protein
MPAAAQATTSSANLRARPVTTNYEAQQLIIHLIEVMDAMLGTVEKETQLVRAGRIKEAARVGRLKDDLARLYVADSARIKASRTYLAEQLPEVLDALRQRHDLFQALFQINIAVLAAVQAVPGYAPAAKSSRERAEPSAA